MKKRKISFARLGKLGIDDDPSQDYAIWMELGDEARFQAAWEMVLDGYKIQGKDLNKLRFQRSVENIRREKS